MDVDELRGRDDDRPPLAHRTDRIALRNETGTPVVFVDDDPLFSVAPNEEAARQSPMKDGVSDIRNQHYAVDADDFDESERVIREIVDQFDGDTGQRFYYGVAGKRAQICGNGLDDYFDGIANFRTIYRDLEDQLEPAGKMQAEGFPHTHMMARAVGMTYVEGVWLRFTTRLTEAPDEEYFASTKLTLTTVDRNGPLKAMWLQDRLDHAAIGSPSAVDRQYVQAQAHLPLGPEPLSNVKEHRLIGVRGDRSGDDAVEYISCENPYYRSEREEGAEQHRKLEEMGVERDTIPRIVGIDRIPLRPRGGSHGVDEDCFIQGEFRVTEFGISNEPTASGVALLSGKANPVRKEDYHEWEAEMQAKHKREKQGFLDRLRR